jgi:LysR family glycine cleavage system transcriptional activator
VTITHPEAEPYHLVYPPGLREWPPLVSFRAWLYDELDRSENELRKAMRERAPAPGSRASAAGSPRQRSRAKRQ